MQPKIITVVAALLLAAIGTGCAQTPPPAPTAAPVAPKPVVTASTALTLRGQDTRIVFDFRLRPMEGEHRELQSDELCCLAAGDASLICTVDGSYLEFSPDDGITLTKDNPLARIYPVGRDTGRDKAMLTYGTLFFIASSVDRLPDGLAAYLSDPGSHRRQALALARKLLDDNGVEFPAMARGGIFSVFIRLSPSGREKIDDAIRSDGTDTDTYVALSR